MVTAAIGAGLALGSAIYGGITSAVANNKARKLIQQQRDANKRWYDTKMAQDYTMRTDAQAAINRQRELLNEQYNKARKSGVVSGATDEAIALQKEAANKSVSDIMTDIASNASAYKDNVEARYKAEDAALNQQQVQNHQQQAAQTAQAASQAVNAGVSLLGNSLAMQTPDAGSSAAPHVGELSSPANTDLTAAGNSQIGVTPGNLGIVNGGLPTPRPVNKIGS